MAAIEPQTVYVDDSGTEPGARIIVAGFCVSTVKRWRQFDAAWRAIEEEEGFEHFHMTEFAGCRPGKWCRDCVKGKTTASDHPWRDWSNTKRKRVLAELIAVICKYTEHGYAIAFTKEDIQQHVIEGEAKNTAPHVVGEQYFTFAVQCCGGQLALWRASQKKYPPLKFVFDICPQYQRDEIAKVFLKPNRPGPAKNVHGVEDWFEVDINGVSYESRRNTRPLLSADMLAWVTAKIRATQLFGKGWGKLPAMIAHRFLKSKKLHIGYNEVWQLQKWNRDVIEFIRAHSGEDDDENDDGIPEILSNR